jgi:hypothetical protein
MTSNSGVIGRLSYDSVDIFCGLYRFAIIHLHQCLYQCLCCGGEEGSI